MGWVIYLQNQQECIPVECLPPACWPYPSMHCGRGGTRPRGVYLPGRYLPWGVYLPQDGTCQGGCTCLGGVPAQVLPLLWTDRHLWKHNLRKLHLRAVKMKVYVCPSVGLFRTFYLLTVGVWCLFIKTSSSFCPQPPMKGGGEVPVILKIGSSMCLYLYLCDYLGMMSLENDKLTRHP